MEFEGQRDGPGLPTQMERRRARTPVKVPAANNIEWTIDTDGYLFYA
jgi:hypothetical protein